MGSTVDDYLVFARILLAARRRPCERYAGDKTQIARHGRGRRCWAWGIWGMLLAVPMMIVVTVA